jgi:hypothetical protein
MRIHVAALVIGFAANSSDAVPLPVSSAFAQPTEMSKVDRRLLVAVAGFDFNEREAQAALAAGANVNRRNDAMDSDTPLIAVIRQFKGPPAIKWLLAHGADPSLTNAKGKTALAYAQQYNFVKTPEGRETLALLGDANTQAPPPERPATPALPKHAPTDPAPAAAPAPGVYECMNQQAVVTPMAFGLIDGSWYMSSAGKRGRYTYDAASAELTLDPGPTPARFKLTGPTVFRPIREDGQLGGFTCPLNRAKNPSRPPW